jgi:uncharacterized protein (TIGR04222 family)
VVEPYLVVCAALLLGSVLARALPLDRRSFDDDHEDGWDLAPRELAYLRRGPYGVVLTVLADLHGCGSVDLTGRRVRRLDPRHDFDDRLAVVVYAGLTWVRRPRLLAWLPSVRRACAPLRGGLHARGLLLSRRRRIFAAALLGYAGGLATLTMLERDLRASTVVSALGVWGVAGLLSLGPRRTVAGVRELRAHRRALARMARQGALGAEYLADLVAAYGVAALRELRHGLVPAGALAPPLPSYEPAVAPAADPGRAVDPGRVVTPAPVVSVWSVIDPEPVIEPWSTAEPWPTGEAWPAGEPWATGEVGPSDEPAPSVEPTPAVEPLADSVPGARPAVGPSRPGRLLEPVPVPVVVELPVRRFERLPVAA